MIGARALVKVKLANQVISVKGFAERRITSDLAIWRGSFAVTSPSLTAGYQALEGDLAKVMAYLKAEGITADAMNVSSVVTTTYEKMSSSGYSTGQIESYQLTQTVTVTSHDVMRLQKLSTESTSLIKQGIGFTSNPPEYYYTKLDEIKIAMLGESTKDARARAEEVAKASGNNVGALRAARQGVFQITPVNSADTSDYGMFDVSSIDKSVKAVVTVDYAIE